MLKAYATVKEIELQINKAESELRELKWKLEEAKVKAFHEKMVNEFVNLDTEQKYDEFYRKNFVIRFGDDEVTIPNNALIWQGIEDLLKEYIEDTFEL